MPFFKELRRRSKASFRTSDSSTESNGTVPTAKSSSTLNSAQGSTTPPSTHHANGSASNVLASAKPVADVPPPVPQRPNVMVPNSSRNSMIVSMAMRCEPRYLARLTKSRLYHPPVRMARCELLFPPPRLRPRSPR